MTPKTILGTYWEDPGHGWLEVPASWLTQLGIREKITSYSYLDRQGRVYLEEDLDMGTFLDAARRHQIKVEWERRYTEDDRIRNLDHYSQGELA